VVVRGRQGPTGAKITAILSLGGAYTAGGSEPRSLAAPVCLASRAYAFVTGVMLPVDGGNCRLLMPAGTVELETR
jgi:hypothetical protein